MTCVVVGVIAVGLLACGKSQEQQAANEKRNTEAVAEQEATGKKVADAAAATKKALAAKISALDAMVKAPKGGKRKLAAQTPPATEANTIVLPSLAFEMKSLLSEKQGTTKIWWILSRAENSAISAIETPDGSATQADLDFVTNAKYLAVLTPIDYVWPNVDVTKNNEYHPGKRTAEVRLYALPTGDYLGGVKFEARSSDELRTTGDPGTALVEQLKGNVTTAMWAALAKGGDAISGFPGWEPLVGHGISVETPWQWNPVAFNPKAPNHILSADYGEGEGMEIMEIYQEPDATSFAADADCKALVAGYAGELKSTVKTSKLDQGACVADLDRDGKHVLRLRYWTQDGKKYSILCDAPTGKANAIAASCDQVWASRTFP